MRRSAIVGALLAGCACVACGASSTSSIPSPPLGAMQVLATSELPGMLSVTRVLTADELANDASITGLAAKIKAWGYLDGRERTFQGESRHLTLVLSRSLIFLDPGGAQSFVTFVKSNSAAYFGDYGEVQQLDAQGRLGWLFAPPLCACHMANPAVIGVVVAGASVSWLEINGPDATTALLVSLLDPSRDEPTTLLD
jgi:hypothetical protein